MQLSTRLSTIFYIFHAAENNIVQKIIIPLTSIFNFTNSLFSEKNWKRNSVLSIFFWLKYIVLYHVINYVFCLPSIEKSETLKIPKCKKCFIPARPWSSNFDNSGREKEILIHGGREKVIWARRWIKVNGDAAWGREQTEGVGRCGPRKSNTQLVTTLCRSSYT